ncbi:MAG: sodium-translocating pyrophosphatase [Clostridia bacterium]|nr:sodium-translocating pyrophosphatase [Clostridia bacterium]MBP3422527.1 sodium-translocating pyrophosphatase [Clostridia bacterium]
MNLLLLIVVFAVVLAVSFAALNFYLVRKLKEGNERMQEIAAAIREGSNAFIRYEYKIVAIIGSIIAVVLGLVICWEAGVTFVIGALMSALAGLVGMKIATYANVRVANTANETRNTGKTLKVAFRGGSVMGLCVAGFALLGIVIVYLIFGVGFNMLEVVDGAVKTKLNPVTGQNYTISLILSGYALGCSVIAMFNRVGGGIYTKAADMGADLVGKTEAHIPEDDPRNPATIADNVGDNVGDVAGLGADLLESYVGAIMSSAILAIELFAHSAFSSTTLYAKMILFPILFAGIGLIACVLGIAFPLVKRKLSDNPHLELNLATWISAGLAIIFGFVLSYFLFKGEAAEQLKAAGFKVGAITPWLAAAVGIAVGIIIGIISEYYTSYDFKPTKKIASASQEGPALTITQGMATGMISCMLPVVCLGAAIFICYLLGGMYGVGCGAMGMLCFVATTVSVDTYGPISDNAGGIAEMSGLDKDVRNITDKLDSVGNTTAAIGKGFAIGSAALATISMMSSYLYSFMESLFLNIISHEVLVGAIVGGALPFLFSGMLINSVAKAARNMVGEVRRQFKEIPGLLEGKARPDYKTCITISSQGALREMIAPAIVAIAFPVVCGFIFGAYFVGGLLIGATLSAIMLAIFTGNAGGAWDNAKKFIEAGGVKGSGKGSEAHDAAVVGDTVGDPLKDTVGPSLDILIKIMSTISLVCVAVFSDYNLMSLITKLF